MVTRREDELARARKPNIFNSFGQNASDGLFKFGQGALNFGGTVRDSLLPDIFGGSPGVGPIGDGTPGIFNGAIGNRLESIGNNLQSPKGFFQKGLGGTEGLGALFSGVGALAGIGIGKDQVANANDILDFKKAAFGINLGNELRTTQAAQDAEKLFLISQYGPNHPLVTGRDFEAERVSATPNLNFNS